MGTSSQFTDKDSDKLAINSINNVRFFATINCKMMLRSAIKLVFIAGLALSAVRGQSPTTCSGTHAPKGPFNSGDLIFEDNFDTLDLEKWQHEITVGGGGNWEFEWYTNSRYNSYVRDGSLFIKPTLVADELGEDFLTSGTVSLWGGSEYETCTNNAWYGCERQGTAENVLNPIKSARLRTLKSFNFKYGKVEWRAKLPTGDWLWPALWLLPKLLQYSTWPASGEIDVMESRGNRDYATPNGEQIGVRRVGQTLHWGPAPIYNRYEMTTVGVQNPAGYDQDFHLYQLEWTPDGLTFLIDDVPSATYAPPEGGFWEMGQLDNTGMKNLWVSGTKMAPFDQEFHLVMNLAVGGTAYFPDDGVNGNGPKPWSNNGGNAFADFWHGKDQWLPTWQMDTENNAFKIDYVKVWAV